MTPMQFADLVNATANNKNKISVIQAEQVLDSLENNAAFAEAVGKHIYGDPTPDPEPVQHEAQTDREKHPPAPRKSMGMKDPDKWLDEDDPRRNSQPAQNPHRMSNELPR